MEYSYYAMWFDRFSVSSFSEIRQNNKSSV